MRRRGDWIQTYTGRQFWPLDPRPSEVDIQDIAHALSNTCRFTGHVREYYSVAEHCVRLSHQVPTEDALWGLLHDATEAYLCDLARPVKRLPELRAYVAAESTLERAICERFGLAPEMPASVKLADARMLFTEKRDLLGPAPATWAGEVEPYPFRIQPWSPSEAKARFLERFCELPEDTPW